MKLKFIVIRQISLILFQVKFTQAVTILSYQLRIPKTLKFDFNFLCLRLFSHLPNF